MNFKISKELKAGIFGILIISALFFLINYLKGRDLFDRTNIYYARYENVEGLTTTGPVFIKGLRVGFVEKIKYVQERDQFVVALSVKSGYNIPENSIAEIYSSDILGTKSIRIVLGDSKKYLVEEDTLLTNVQAPLINMLTQEIIPLKEKAEALIVAMNKTFDNINYVLDDKTKNDISSSIAKLEATLNNLQEISGNLKERTPEVNEIIGNIKDVSGDLKSGSKNINRTISNIESITDSLNSADLKGSIVSLKDLLEKMQDPKGSMGKILTTDSLHTNINNLLREMDLLIKNINQNPKKYIKVTVF